MRRTVVISILTCTYLFALSQQSVKVYHLQNDIYYYEKPKAFDFITSLPKDAAQIAVIPFQKKIEPVVAVLASTALLLMADEQITKNVRSFSDRIHLQSQENYNDILKIKLGTAQVSLLKAPQNINTGLYQVGQGFPSLLIGAGLFSYGKIHNDYRALSTANQLAESFILMGFYTQLLKRISGRQSPSEAPQLECGWHLFPSLKDFQHHTPNYDAFPSGHLATLMSSVTVLAENYPDIRWIRPLGYSITGLVGFSMINNEVHWVSDYPLALALGYLCARQVVKHNRKREAIHQGRLSIDHASFTVHYLNGVVLPGICYSF